MSQNNKKDRIKIKTGLVTRLLIAIALGILIGRLPFIPEWFIRILVTLSGLFSAFLGFFIPLMIVGLVTKGIAELTEGAGKLLGITALISYGSTIIAGSLAYFIANTIFPSFITSNLVDQITGAGEGVEAFFSIPLTPILDVTAAIVFAFMLGLAISWLRANKNTGQGLFQLISEFEAVIVKVLEAVIIPLLPVYILGNFANMAYSGSVFAVLSIFWKVFVIVIILHILYVSLMFFVAGGYAGKNPLRLIKNQIPGYMTAVGTQSSAATIPVNIDCAENNGVSEQIRNFVVPLCATIHLAGSMITITSCTTALLLMYNLPHSFANVFGFICMLGIAMVAAPGAPGGAIMSALPFLPMVGIATDAMQQLMISLYLTQDSFGTAANVSGDNAIAVFIDKLYAEKIKS